MTNQAILDALVREIEDAFSVRRPLGLDIWVAERARNLAQRLGFQYTITPVNQENSHGQEVDRSSQA